MVRIVAALLLTSGVAQAQESVVGRPLTNPAGTVTINGNVDVNLSRDAVAKPVWVTPNIYFGVTDRLTVGIVHGAWEDIMNAGGGFCLGGNQSGCGRVYDNVGLDALLALVRQPGFELAAHFGLDDVSINAGQWDLHAGVALKHRSGRFTLLADPGVSVQFTKRGQDQVFYNGRGNTESLAIPVRLALDFGPAAAGFLDVGFAAPLDSFSDYYVIPVGVGALAAVSPVVDVGAKFEFQNLAGKNHNTAGRDLMFLFRFHP